MIEDRSHPAFLTPLRILGLLAGVAALGLLVILPLNWKDQAVFGALLFGFAIWIHVRSKHYGATVVLIVLALFTTTRYLYWRVTETFGFLSFNRSEITSWEVLPVFLLLAAELYGFVIMVLGYVQSVWPLRRQVVPLPEDPESWPVVDVFIPTVNEPLDILRPTVLAAMNLDWPEDKLRVHVLDDGRRAEVRHFAAQCGVDYITRENNVGAKAGNLNHALKQTSAEFVAVFDSDHVPTRSFLQMTMGGFLQDQRLALVQTPHLFYSPDPFERNLNSFRVVPNEGALFYGVVQPGNDFWNAAFFCGSCAVLRRTALDEVGGISTESVTEDSHTSVKMSAKGWSSSFLGIPLAGGLATSTLRDHLRQRIRWARGMTQVLRRSNPLFLRGLSIPQRICYFNSVIHFLHAGPRLVFLTAPLAYLMFGVSNLYGYVWAILAYGLPHIFIATLTSARFQGQFRRAFWGELYEAILSPYILLPTLIALVVPSRGRFNVTPKRAFVDRYHFDLRIALPLLALIGLNLAGVGMAIPKMMADANLASTLSINVFWALYNVAMLGAGLAVAWEPPQRRVHTRVPVRLGGRMLFSDGEEIDIETSDVSMGGAAVQLRLPHALATGDRVAIRFPAYGEEAALPAIVAENTGLRLRLQFDGELGLEQVESLTRLVFSRADAWLDWRFENHAHVPALVSLGGVLKHSYRGLTQLPRALRTVLFPDPAPGAAKVARGAPALPLLILLLAAGLLFAVRAWGQAPIEVEFNDTVTLQDLGQTAPIMLRGSGASYTIRFGTQISKVVRSADLVLRYRMADQIAPGLSRVNVSLNETGAEPVPLAARGVANTASETTVSLPVGVMMSDNTLRFELTAMCGSNCDGIAASDLWARIEVSTEIHLHGTRLPLASNVGLLPAPFFDASAAGAVRLPVVFGAQPDGDTLRAAGVVISWFGVRTDDRGLHAPVTIDDLPPGNVIAFARSGSALATRLGVEPAAGPAVAIRDNPVDPYSKVLVLTGATSADLAEAAVALASGQLPKAGATVAVDSFEKPPASEPYDIPRWIRPGSETPLSQFVGGESLRIYGSGSRSIYFRLPPDLAYGSRTWIPLHLHYQYSGLTPGTTVGVKVEINGNAIKEQKIVAQLSREVRRDLIPVPVQYLYPSNTLHVEFQFGQDDSQGASYPEAEILTSSALELPNLQHFVEMPALELFANAGYPFTRLADLSETAVVLPEKPSLEQMALYLDLMGFFGAKTGAAGTGVVTLTPEQARQEEFAEFKDLVVIGSREDQPLFREWQDEYAVSLTGDRVTLNDLARPWQYLQTLPWTVAGRERRKLADLLMLGEAPAAAIVGFASPTGPGRSVVMLATRDPRQTSALTDVLVGASGAEDIYGSVSLMQDGGFHSFRLGLATYNSGSQGWGVIFDYWMHRYLWLLPLLIVGFAFLVAAPIPGWVARRAQRRLDVAS